MKTQLIARISCVLALGLAACSDSTGGDTDASPPTTYDTAPQAVDTYVPPPAVDTAPAIDTAAPFDPFVWVVVQDTEQKACTTNGPGTDVDAVALWNATTNLAMGWGKLGTATFTKNPAGNACENAECSGGNCKYSAIGAGTTFNTTYSADVRVGWTEGPADAKVSATSDDSGYFSLNAGTLQIQIGDLTGIGPAQQIPSGSAIKVFEVDKSYITSGSAPASCACAPEHYTVMIQSVSGKYVELMPYKLDPSNTTCTISATSDDGCGSTVFMVP